MVCGVGTDTSLIVLPKAAYYKRKRNDTHPSLSVNTTIYVDIPTYSISITTELEQERQQWTQTEDLWTNQPWEKILVVSLLKIRVIIYWNKAGIMPEFITGISVVPVGTLSNICVAIHWYTTDNLAVRYQMQVCCIYDLWFLAQRYIYEYWTISQFWMQIFLRRWKNSQVLLSLIHFCSNYSIKKRHTVERMGHPFWTFVITVSSMMKLYQNYLILIQIFLNYSDVVLSVVVKFYMVRYIFWPN